MKRSRLEAELVGHHEDAWGWALSCCAWEEDRAQDVLQDAYLRVLDGRARFAGRSAFRTWLFGVIRRVALEHGRRRRREAGRLVALPGAGEMRPGAAAQGPGGASAGISSGEDPGARLHRAERARALRQTLTALSERQREVLHLVFYQGLTIAQAAEVMGVRLGTARTHYERGKERLRKELGERWTS